MSDTNIKYLSCTRPCVHSHLLENSSFLPEEYVSVRVSVCLYSDIECTTETFDDTSVMTANGWTWEFQHFNTLSGSNSCDGDFHAYRGGTAVGVLRKIFSSSATVTLEYGNCWGDAGGEAVLFLDQAQIDSAGPRTFNTKTFDVEAGSQVEIKDFVGNSVISVKSMEVCSAPGKPFL